jgi:hypothetical protein
MQHAPTFGIEEEVFVVEPTKPTVQSLYYLAKLVWRKPSRYLLHTDSNFSRNSDIFQGLMSGVEISTGIHSRVDELIDDLMLRRNDLAKAAEGLIVPLGHLLDYQTPSNTCSLQFHLGNLDDCQKVYSNLVYFLPVLIVLASNSPAYANFYYGKTYRLLNSYAVGALRSDWSFRFQDIIFAKRTGTIEIRAFDSFWDIKRLTMLARAIEAIAKLKVRLNPKITEYNALRRKISRYGFVDELESRYARLSQICYLPKVFLQVTPSDIVWKHFKKHGLEKTYSALDYGYRNSCLKIQEIQPTKRNVAKIVTGFAGYYIPKLPYDLYKYIREH